MRIAKRIPRMAAKACSLSGDIVVTLSFFGSTPPTPEAGPQPARRPLDLTRQLIASVLGRSGFTTLGPAPLGDDDGIDFVVRTPDGATLAIIAVDIDESGSAQLSTHPVYGLQFCQTWLDAVVDNMHDDSPVRQALANARATGSLKIGVSGVDKVTKGLVMTPIAVP